MNKRIAWLAAPLVLIGLWAAGSTWAADGQSGDVSGVTGCQIATATPATGQILAATGSKTCAWSTPAAGIALPVSVPNGGTGVATLTGCLLGNGTSNVTGVSSGYGFTCSSAAVGLSTLTNSLSGNTSLNNTSNFFDLASVAQGSTGTWCGTGQFTGTDTVSAATLLVKLWDGTTVIDSGEYDNAIGKVGVVHLSGCLASPAANIRISAKDPTSVNGIAYANTSGGAKDNTITVWRVA